MLLCTGFCLIFNCSIFSLPPLQRNHKWQNHKPNTVVTILGSCSRSRCWHLPQRLQLLWVILVPQFLFIWAANTMLLYAFSLFRFTVVGKQLHHKDWQCAGLNKRVNAFLGNTHLLSSTVWAFCVWPISYLSSLLDCSPQFWPTDVQGLASHELLFERLYLIGH